ncbi:MAG: hypothetical protein R2838_00025 [Caldilineaceae bacterium]
MGIFFATILVFTALYVIHLAGGLALFANVASVQPNRWSIRQAGKMLELWLGLGFAWVLPHMWQKFYSAQSPRSARQSGNGRHRSGIPG